MTKYAINFYNLVSDLLPSFLRNTLKLAWLYSCAVVLRNLHYTFELWGAARKEELKWNGQTIVLEHFLRAKYANNSIRIENLLADTNGTFIGTDEDAAWYIGQDGDNTAFIGTTYNAGIENFIVYVPAGLAYDPNEMRLQIDRYKLYGTTFTIIEE